MVEDNIFVVAVNTLGYHSSVYERLLPADESIFGFLGKSLKVPLRTGLSKLTSPKILCRALPTNQTSEWDSGHVCTQCLKMAPDLYGSNVHPNLEMAVAGSLDECHCRRPRGGIACIL